MSLNTIFTAMQKISPDIGNHIKTYWKNTLRDYLHSIWQCPISDSSEITVKARYAFIKILRQIGFYHNSSLDDIVSEFNRYPILQTGPHCQLYTTEIDFNAILMSWLGAKLSHLKYYFILNSATRTLQWSSQTGPGWLNLSSQNVNLLGLSAKKMSRLSLCGIQGPLQYQINAIKQAIENSIDENEKKGLIKLLPHLTDTYKNGIDAFTLPNIQFITHLDNENTAIPIILNDLFTGKVIAEHLKDSSSLIYKILFDPHYRNKLNQITSGIKNLPHHIFLKEGTYLFWGLRENKIRSLILEDNKLVETDGASVSDPIKIRFLPEEITKALNEHVLIPNIFLSFLALSLLPQVRVLGGTRQIAYYPLIRTILFTLLEDGTSEERELLHLINNNNLHAWGTYFIRAKQSPLQLVGSLPTGKEFNQLADLYLDQDIASITNNMSVFLSHPRWKQFLN